MAIMQVRFSHFPVASNHLRGCFRAGGQACWREGWVCKTPLVTAAAIAWTPRTPGKIRVPGPLFGRAHTLSLENRARRVFREHLRRQHRKLVERRRPMTMERHSKPRSLQLA